MGLNYSLLSIDIASMRIIKNYLFAAFAIPLSSTDWVELKYKNIKPNQVTFEDSQIKIQVNQSASPLIHRLKVPMKINGFDLKVSIKGQILNSRGDVFGEDSFFRLGFVATGKKTLNWWQKKMAANWVLQLFSMAPAGVGLDKIYFYNLSSFGEQLGKSRIHPQSDLMHEEVIAITSENKELLEVNHLLQKPLEIVALWLSSDGDDSKSQFKVSIQKIALKNADN